MNHATYPSTLFDVIQILLYWDGWHAREQRSTDLKDTRRFAGEKSEEAGDDAMEEMPDLDDAEIANATVKIQAGFRGMMARKGVKETTLDTKDAAPDDGGGHAEGKALSNRRKMRKLLLLHVATVQTKG